MSEHRPERTEPGPGRRNLWQYVAGVCVALLIGGALAASAGQAQLALGLVFCGCFAGAAAVWAVTRQD